MVEAEVGKPVEFVVNEMRVLGEWAFVIATPQRPGGGKPGHERIARRGRRARARRAVPFGSQIGLDHPAYPG